MVFFDGVDREIEALSSGLRARLIRLLELVEAVGLEQLREPHIKHLDGKLWGLRVRAGEGIAGGVCVTVTGRQMIVLYVFVTRLGATTEGDRSIMKTLAELKTSLMSDPAFQSDYAEADAEFRLIEALIRARTNAKLSQAQLAERLGTTQSAIARLEGGRVSPSVSTLRRYAEATGTRLEIQLVGTDRTHA